MYGYQLSLLYKSTKRKEGKKYKKKLEEKTHTREINIIQSRLVMKEIKKLRRFLIQIG